jgi:hypothetical protein
MPTTAAWLQLVLHGQVYLPTGTGRVMLSRVGAIPNIAGGQHNRRGDHAHNNIGKESCSLVYQV